ncbi:hypothetical protein ACJRO7_025166 [Eucalyptus globulus]|uniref:Uncharacterized protein n=1 Tax=Eucalyptus globulus TaxID=34317 RepID=A0ABD3KK80_EUCGL
MFSSQDALLDEADKWALEENTVAQGQPQVQKHFRNQNPYSPNTRAQPRSPGFMRCTQLTLNTRALQHEDIQFWAGFELPISILPGPTVSIFISDFNGNGFREENTALGLPMIPLFDMPSKLFENQASRGYSAKRAWPLMRLRAVWLD